MSTAWETLCVTRIELGRRLIPYQEGWDLQRRVHDDVGSGRRPPTVLLLEHEAVFTAGKRTQPPDRPVDGSPVIEVDRGGRITWHGPGQLVCYPIVPLGQPFDVVAHVRRLEEAVLRTCADFGIVTMQVPGRSGLWCAADGAATPDDVAGSPKRKIAAIGVRVARSVTMHGLALNINCDLSWAQRIVPCGIADASVTSMQTETGREYAITDIADALERHLRDLLEPTLATAAAYELASSKLDP